MSFMLYQSYLKGFSAYQEPKYLRPIPLVGAFVFGAFFMRSLLLLRRDRKTL